MNETQRRLAIAKALQGLESCAGYQEYRLAMALLMGDRDQFVTVKRSFMERFRNAITEFRRDKRLIPVRPV